MNGKLIFAIIFITAALVFYTIGVFSERRAKSLNKNHVLFFWLGLLCDSTGTFLMGQIAKNQVVISKSAGMIHGITGFAAIVLMIFHAVWATYVLKKNDDDKKRDFHKFSIIVWLIWLIPYVIGMVIGMSK
ncbi:MULTISPECIES: HsmA family protein [Clostridium]|uniref:TIGR03987 family protein n=1 Tax=Clostridium butyricum TaxID=1492 RepID=A0AAP9RGI8_CLOBU|nr:MULTISPECIES: HsmA family protein [Clostridium]ALP89677.1 hypothetical protein ATN24_05875 [Clostridium butyricum]ALS16132.1 hypothetical protein ATD26_04435 [Clostridium butyricum]ANF13290.1 hypothetical protein AZ909_04315 [Clostridium butyricum]AOR93360.1 TIGR03987 family protein [Clostridium butyricum]EMU53753.1 hypothetical protein CBDKU1_22690 [Clostridium butyricum DKU-01]